MSSRDFDFLTLRNMVAYQPNGGKVPNNYILTVNDKGDGTFTNTISPSTVNASTIFASSIYTDSLNAEVISSITYFGDLIECKELKADISIDVPEITTSSLTVSSINQPGTDVVVLGGLEVKELFTTNNGIIEQLNTSSILATSLLTEHITTSSISSLALRLFNNISSVFVTTNGQDMLVDGYPVLTEGNIPISSLYWEDTLGTPSPGAIYNKNDGTHPLKYMVGVGTGAELNGTLSVKYGGTGTGNALHISSYNNSFAFKNISTNATFQSLAGELTNNQNNIFGNSLQLKKTINFSATSSSCELGTIEFYGLNNNLSTVKGAHIKSLQSGGVSTFTTSRLEFLTCTSSVQNTNMVIDSIGNVGIGVASPEYKLDVASDSLIRGQLSTLNKINVNSGGINVTSGGINVTSGGININGASIFNSTLCASTLCTSSILMTSGRLVGVSSINGAAYPPIDDALWSQSGNNIYNDNTGNVGIGITSPSYKLHVSGDIYASGNITAGSDMRFKTNINTLEKSLSTIKNLRGVSYYSKENQIKNIGVIAQEVEKVLPEVVYTDNSENKLKSVAYGNIVAILIEAIKELSVEVDNLKNKINSLEEDE